MSSFTSNSEGTVTNAWRRFFVWMLKTALALGVFVYGFVALVDPWDTLPLSLKFRRAVVSTNARFSFPALARSQDFDSASFGTSTTRLLRPEVLNPRFDASFVNLAMNAATAYEQSKLLTVFARNHPQAKVVMIGIDDVWCGIGETYERYTPRPFPEWMYQSNRWLGYREIFNLYAVQEAGQQFAIAVGIKKARYHSDGYTNFLPDEARYDPQVARSRLASLHFDAVAQASALNRAALHYPTHPLLETALQELPRQTRKILFFVPYYLGFQPPDGSDGAIILDECKVRIAKITGRVGNGTFVDFMIPSPITSDPTHYWDSRHYRVPIVDQLMADLIDAAQGRESLTGDYVLHAAGANGFPDSPESTQVPRD